VLNRCIPPIREEGPVTDRVGIVAPAVAETIGLVERFKELRDPRQKGKIDYRGGNPAAAPDHGAGGRRAHHRYSSVRRDEDRPLRRLRPFANGTDATIIWAIFSPHSMPNSSSAASPPTAVPPRGVITIDGKASRRTRSKGKAVLYLG
jgi:hypothetical protein